MLSDQKLEKQHVLILKNITNSKLQIRIFCEAGGLKGESNGWELESEDSKLRIRLQSIESPLQNVYISICSGA